MLVFYAERLVFLSVPKTGTTAYQTALGGRADMAITAPPALKHAPLYRYNRFFRPMFDKVCGADMELMAVMREPVSWLHSWYRYRQRAALSGHPKSTEGVSFDEFVHAYTKGKRPAFADVGSQAKFLKPQPNGTSVKHLFAYEDQGKLQAFLAERLSVDLNVPRKNVSPEGALDLSPAMRRCLENRCCADFELYASIPK